MRPAKLSESGDRGLATFVHWWGPMRFLLLVACTGLIACAPGAEVEHDPLDFEEAGGGGKADGPLSTFQPNRVVSDEAFFEVGALTADQVQAFLEDTPYGRRSFLADHRLDDGQRVSAALVAAAERHQLNPLVLLVTLQKEAGLISRSISPGGHRVDYAFGCGCPDGGGCMSAYRGLDRQLECAAARFREYADDLDAGGTTIAGYRPGKASRVLDGTTVVPANQATAMLYTYTPWILRGSGGNWLFWNVWRRYAIDLGYERGLGFPFNEGFIGGACGSDADCFYDGGVCRGAICTLPCTSICPDRAGGFATTFCAAGEDGEGWCAAQCDTGLVAGGCPDGQSCVAAVRPSDAGVSREVCVEVR
jgi:hypothetical protein